MVAVAPTRTKRGTTPTRTKRTAPARPRRTAPARPRGTAPARPGDGTGSTTGDGTGSTTGDGTGSTTGDGTGSTTGDGTGSTTGDGTGSTTGDGTDDPYEDDDDPYEEDDDPYEEDEEDGTDPFPVADPDEPIVLDMAGTGQSIELSLDSENDQVNVILDFDLSEFEVFADGNPFSSEPLPEDDLALFGPEPSSAPQDGYMLETRVESMNILSLGNAVRRGELDTVQIGKAKGIVDIVSGTETATVGGKIREHNGHGLNYVASRVESTIGGRMSITSRFEDSIMLGGAMTDTWVGATMIGAGMSDDLCAGAGVRVTAPVDLWLNMLTGMEERPGTVAADGVFVEACGTLFEREYGPSVYAVGTGTWTGTTYLTTKSGFRPLMRVAMGVRNLVPGAGAASEEQAPPSPPPAAAAGGAVAGAGLVMGGANMARAGLNVGLAGDGMFDAMRAGSAVADASGAHNIADLRRTADTATQLEDLRSQANLVLTEDWATTSDDLFMQASEMDEINPRRAAAMTDAADQLDVAKGQVLRGEDPRPGLLAKAKELDDLGYADEAAVLRGAADSYGDSLGAGLSVRPRVDIPDGSPGTPDLNDDLVRVPFEENAEYSEMAAKWSDKVDHGPGGALLPDIAKDYYELLDSGHPVAKSLTLDEYSSMVLYTGTYYREINGALRATDAASVDPTWLAMGQTATEAMAKLQDARVTYRGPTYRGTRGSRLAALEEGGTVTDAGLGSASTDYLVAFDFAQKHRDSPGLQIIFSETGVPLDAIARNADEAEILFNAGDEFTVLFKHSTPQTAWDPSFTRVVMSSSNLPPSHGTLGLGDSLTDFTPVARRAGDSGTSVTDALDLARLDVPGFRLPDPEIDDYRHLVAIEPEQAVGAAEDAAGAARRQAETGFGATDVARADLDLGGAGPAAQPQIDEGGARWDVGVESRSPDPDTGEHLTEGSYADVSHHSTTDGDGVAGGTGPAQADPPDTRAVVDAMPDGRVADDGSYQTLADARAEATETPDWKEWFGQVDEIEKSADSPEWAQMNDQIYKQYLEYRRDSHWRGTMAYGEAIDKMRTDLVEALVDVGGYTDEAANEMSSARAAYEALAGVVEQAGRADDWATVQRVGDFLEAFDAKTQDTITDLASRSDELDGVKNYEGSVGSVHDLDHTIDRQKLAAEFESRQLDAATRMNEAVDAGDTALVERLNDEMTYYQQMGSALERGRNPLTESGDQIAYLRSVGRNEQADDYLKLQSQLVATLSDPEYHKTAQELGAHASAPTSVLRTDLGASSQPSRTITYVPGAADNIDMQSFLRADLDEPGGAAAHGDAGVPATAGDYAAGRDMVNQKLGDTDYVRAPEEQPKWLEGPELKSILKKTDPVSSERYPGRSVSDYMDSIVLKEHMTAAMKGREVTQSDMAIRAAAANGVWGVGRPPGAGAWKSPTQRATKGVRFGDSVGIYYEAGRAVGVADGAADAADTSPWLRINVETKHHVQAPSGDWVPTRQPGFGRTASASGDFPFSVREKLLNSLMQGQRIDPENLSALNTEFVSARTQRYSTAASGSDWMKMSMLLRDLRTTHLATAAYASDFARSLDGKTLGKLLDLFESSATLA